MKAIIINDDGIVECADRLSDEDKLKVGKFMLSTSIEHNASIHPEHIAGIPCPLTRYCDAVRCQNARAKALE